VKPELYCHDVALCDCEPTHSFHGVPCILVVRDRGFDRCAWCGLMWTTKEYRADESFVLGYWSEVAA
jgi:hypothetical protein